MKRYVILGAGAIGSYYGGRLSAAGHDVTFVARGQHLQAMQQTGLVIDSYIGRVELPQIHAVRQLSDIPDMGNVEAIFVCVKVHDLAPILSEIKQNSGENALLIACQNGVEAETMIIDAVGKLRTAGGVAFIGSEVTSAGVVTHTSRGEIVLGAYEPTQQNRVAAVVEDLLGAGIKATLSADIRVDKWTKLMWNAGFNPTTALTGKLAKQMLTSEDDRNFVRRLMQEVFDVAAAEGVALDPNMIEEYITRTRAMGEVRTSMLVDKEKGRPLEIDAIAGAVVRIGRKHGLDTPANFATWVLVKKLVEKD